MSQEQEKEKPVLVFGSTTGRNVTRYYSQQKSIRPITIFKDGKLSYQLLKPPKSWNLPSLPNENVVSSIVEGENKENNSDK